MSDDLQTLDPTTVRSRPNPDGSGDIAACPTCGDTHQGGSQLKAEARARACCRPDHEIRHASYHTTSEPQRGLRREAARQVGLQPDQAITLAADVHEDHDRGGWRADLTLVGPLADGGGCDSGGDQR